MHSGGSNENSELKPLNLEELHKSIDFRDEEGLEGLSSQIPSEWKKYIDAGLDLKRGNPGESDILYLLHSLGQKTNTKPLVLTKGNEIGCEVHEEEFEAESGDNEGPEESSGETIEEDECEVEYEYELAEQVKSNLLRIVKIEEVEEPQSRKKKKRKRNRKKQKAKKMGLMDFLKDPAKAPLVVEKKEEECETPKKKVVRRRRRKKGKVIDLSQAGKMTEADILEETRFLAKISVKKDFKMDTTSRAQYEGEKGVKAWSGGSGYGSSYTQDTKAWDVNDWLTNEDQRQSEIRDTLSAITKNLTEHPLLVDFLTQSCMMNVLYNYCENDSLNDVESKSKLYTEVFECVGKMMSVPALAHLLHQKIGRFSIAECVATLAEKFQKRLALEKLDSGEENALASLVISLSDALNQTEEEVVESRTESEQKEEEDYCELMRELCFDSVESMAEFPGHKYSKTKVNMKRKLMKRLAAEYSDLGSSLPIHEESSVFFRFCEESMSHAQMLIIPPEGTPYAGGCFIFDVCFPENYPQGPPKVNLQTTGRGAVRFNPNLYNCGKVCLSLLGTWGGNSQGEKWNSKLSSFLQVAISIQSLIFVPEPYYNEPGWESYMGTADGDRRSRNYNKVIEKGTVDYAIVEMLENPPAAFKDVINNHFRLQADRVLSNVARWMGEDAAVTQKVETLLTELRRKAYSTGV